MLAILRVQGAAVDVVDLRATAIAVGLADLLDRALEAAGSA